MRPVRGGSPRECREGRQRCRAATVRRRHRHGRLLDSLANQGGVWFRSLVKQSSSIPLYARLVGERRSGVIPEKKIFLKYPEQAGSKKSTEPTCSRFFACLPFALHLLSPPELGLLPDQAQPATTRALPVAGPSSACRRPYVHLYGHGTVHRYRLGHDSSITSVMARARLHG
jgi:hypothetical protein